MKGHILPYARGISCIKGVKVDSTDVSLFSEAIGEKLGIYCGALSGANIANEVAQEKFSETTIAYDPLSSTPVILHLSPLLLSKLPPLNHLRSILAKSPNTKTRRA